MAGVARAALDRGRTLILWSYFLLGYLFVLLPLYPIFILRYGRTATGIQALHHRFFRGFFALCRWLMPRLSIEIAPEVRAIGPSVVVCNHLSYLDPLLLISLFSQQATLVRPDFFRLPIFGHILRAAGYVGFDPNAPDHPSSLGAIEQHLSRGGTLFVFPEGHRSRDGKLGRFERGAFHLARQCRVPLYALYLRNTDRLFPRGRFWFCTCNKTEITLKLLAVLPAETFDEPRSDRKARDRLEALYRAEGERP